MDCFLIDDNKDADTAAPPEQEPKEDIKKKEELYAAALIGSASLQELKDVWVDIPAEYRTKLGGVKDTTKAQLTGANNV